MSMQSVLKCVNSFIYSNCLVGNLNVVWVEKGFQSMGLKISQRIKAVV